MPVRDWLAGSGTLLYFGCDLVVLHGTVCMISAIRVSIRIGDTLWSQVVYGRVF